MSAKARHGHAKTRTGRPTPTWRSWHSMRQRCLRPGAKHAAYKGVVICERWSKFENFLADMGERPLGTTLDRIDNGRGYEPGNCRWATSKIQGSNRGCVDLISFGGKTLNPEDWARELGLKPQTIRSRIARGWPLERVMTKTPKRGTPGETGRHKIAEADAREIKRLKPRGKAAAAWASKLGVGVGAIQAIVAGRSWSHLS